ncbi:MAG: UDP-N-acetylmuramoyl-L-alanyl-D-glutamate--2,6-diaminopimelate ligase [Clostridia bacterium]|nr:UDP-N-acetylmuramoyl-L-alanyl-D-glutamate--2,6-diaminopimelate ligase [Clostridia bacterium]
MRLYQIIKPEELLSLRKPIDKEIGFPRCDAGKIAANDVFFCEDGFRESGFFYVDRAVANGASFIITHRGGARRIGTLTIPILEVEDVRASYALAWSRYENEPASRMRLIAVTGTNGKTSVTSFLHALLSAAGEKAGLIGTVEYSDGERRTPSAYTTPPPDVLYPLLSDMKKKGAGFAVMEASSHAIAQKRLHGLSFETAVFTGLSRDHLDYHKTWEAYRDTKASLFASAKNALINADDPSAKYMGFSARGDVYYYGKSPGADFEIRDAHCASDGIRYTLRLTDTEIPVHIPVIGKFHVYNSAAAIAAAYLAGIPTEALTRAIPLLKAPTGRLEKIYANTDFSVYIDYAHTPDALVGALLSLRPFTKKLTVLFGAGGDRDKGKRPEMGAAAEVFADLVILTSDNPRGESPSSIIDDIESGMKRMNHIRIENRTQAIAYALRQAEAGEILLLAGKGHENYTVDENGTHAFSEREIVHHTIEEMRKGNDNVSQSE